MAKEPNELTVLRSLMVHVMQVENSAGILLHSAGTKRRKSARQKHVELLNESADKIGRKIDKAEPFIFTRDGMPAALWILGIKS